MLEQIILADQLKQNFYEVLSSGGPLVMKL